MKQPGFGFDCKKEQQGDDKCVQGSKLQDQIILKNGLWHGSVVSFSSKK